MPTDIGPGPPADRNAYTAATSCLGGGKLARGRTRVGLVVGDTAVPCQIGSDDCAALETIQGDSRRRSMRLPYCVCECYVSETPESKPHLLMPARMDWHLVSRVAIQFTCSNSVSHCFNVSGASSEVSELTASVMTYPSFFSYDVLSFLLIRCYFTKCVKHPTKVFSSYYILNAMFGKKAAST